jgi:hypothetical protein
MFRSIFAGDGRHRAVHVELDVVGNERHVAGGQAAMSIVSPVSSQRTRPGGSAFLADS